MAIIIKSKNSSKNYILLGTGYGLFHSQTGSVLVGDLIPNKQSGNTHAVCACDKNGKIVWLSSDQVEIVSVDGKRPSDYNIDDSGL